MVNCANKVPEQGPECEIPDLVTLTMILMVMVNWTQLLTVYLGPRVFPDQEILQEPSLYAIMYTGSFPRSGHI